MSKLRVYELAKELNIKPQDVLDSLQGTQYEVKTSSNSIDEDAQKLVRSKVNGAAKPAAEKKPAAETKPAGEAKAATGLPIVTELMSAEYLDVFNEKVDLIQIGARNMQNFDLLKQLGQVDRPILLKRGLNATYEEWLMSAEYIMASGNENVILCERGVRTFESYTRNTLDLQSIPVIQKLSHLPIIIDPSHAGGKWWLVEPMAKAAVAAGANGLMIEVHNNPEMALCDGSQSLKPAKYDALLKQVAEIAKVVGKTF